MKAPFARNDELPDVTITIAGGSRTFKSTIAQLITFTLLKEAKTGAILYDDEEVVSYKKRLEALAESNLKIEIETVATSRSSSSKQQ